MVLNALPVPLVGDGVVEAIPVLGQAINKNMRSSVQTHNKVTQCVSLECTRVPKDCAPLKTLVHYKVCYCTRPGNALLCTKSCAQSLLQIIAQGAH